MFNLVEFYLSLTSEDAQTPGMPGWRTLERIDLPE
jgi:hypothetical protein